MIFESSMRGHIRRRRDQENSKRKEAPSMLNVFLVNPKKKIVEKLAEGGFSLSDFNSETENGIMIHADESKVQEFIKGLLLKGESIEVTNTNMDGIIRYKVIKTRNKAIKHPPTVKIQGEWHGYKQREFMQAAEDLLLPLLKKNIMMESRSTSAKTPPKDKKDNFYIFINSAPSGISDGYVPHRVFGIRSRTDYMFRTSRKGIPIVDWATGTEVAEVVDNALYIHIYLTAHSDSGRTKLFKAILEEYILYFHTPKKKRERTLKSREAQRKKQAEAEYIKLVEEQKAVAIQNLIRSVDETDRAVVRYQKELVKNIRKGVDLKERLTFLETGQAKQKKAIKKEYKKILEMKKIKGISFDNGTMIVNTTTLYCQDPRTEIIHNIGEFNIHIRINPEPEESQSPDRLVTFFNLTRRPDGYNNNMNAPHVFANGTPCLGTLHEILAQQIANYEFAIVVTLALQFIENVNTQDSAGKHICRWPVARHSKVRIKDLTNKQRVTEGGFRMYPAIPEPEKPPKPANRPTTGISPTIATGTGA
jgi:hypothetical protein